MVVQLLWAESDQLLRRFAIHSSPARISDPRRVDEMNSNGQNPPPATYNRCSQDARSLLNSLLRDGGSLLQVISIRRRSRVPPASLNRDLIQKISRPSRSVRRNPCARVGLEAHRVNSLRISRQLDRGTSSTQCPATREART